ncbi:anaerobic C4-dicarboxylate transporter family protein [Salinisphaera sp. G21_0]|uniref:anaerobic C4-dicarboxylate transporter family protein n=1 Tax=Salinisphaera sp. G21_0 TaxID=2821094 RepID=UPI001AD9BBE6|nr:anaerobic C4-dicarboxylate transporter family protein [Salinisphaera sp. G21_0]MBO9483340.1 hypothetical protein [Salinisphaera sp. G21_0]
MLGTGHSVYSVMPIIGDIALKNKIRPERPMAAASIASQLAITASPLSAAVVYYLTQLSGIDAYITLASILGVSIPSGNHYSLPLQLCAGVSSWKTTLNSSVVWLIRLLAGKLKKPQPPAWTKFYPHRRVTRSISIAAIATIVLVAMMPVIRTIGEKAIKMDAIIQMIKRPLGYFRFQSSCATVSLRAGFRFLGGTPSNQMAVKIRIIVICTNFNNSMTQ